MDLFSIFRVSPERQIAKARKRVKEPHGDASVRIGAAQKLHEMGTSDALQALLDRFKIAVSPSVVDEQEKEQVLNWIVGHGEISITPLMRFLKSERQVYWPLRALRSIVSREGLISRLEELLRYHWANPPASPEPQAQMIRSLGNLYSAGLEEVVRFHLKERDDDIRLASLDYLFGLPEQEVRKAIIECFFDSEDRPRIRAHILDCLSSSNWSVKGYRRKIEQSLPEEYVLTRDGKVRRIGKGF
jgi:HEAT repeat protein